MNDNPEGMPTETPVAPTTESTTTPEVSTPETVASPAPSASEPTINPDPMARPMEKAEQPEVAKPKKKTGLIVGLIIGLVVLIGGGVAIALVLLNSEKPDAVSQAFSKVMEGKAPTNMVVDGSINFAISDTKVPFENIKLDLKSEGIATSFINSSSAVMTATLRDGDDIKINLDEVYASSGDLYFKVDGIEGALKDLETVYGILNLSQTEKLETSALETTTEGTTIEETTELDETTLEVKVDDTTFMETLIVLLGVVKPVDGEWLKLSMDELSTITQNTTNQSNLNCFVDFVGNVGNNTNTLADTYRRNPFVQSTNEKLLVASKNNPIYKVVLNEENFNGFVKSTTDSVMAEQLFNCLGYSNAEVDTGSIIEDLKQLPDLYVEVDNDLNFTRLYFVSEINNGDVEITTDLGFSYPTNINVAEPLEYKDFSEVISEIFKGIYSIGD